MPLKKGTVIKMSILFEENLRKGTLADTAKKMLAAARTAPKARGFDNLVLALVEKEEIEKITEKMIEMVDRGEAAEFFIRDAKSILKADVMVLIGTRIKTAGLMYCGLCGFKDCEEKNSYPESPCTFNTGDLGIAVGSAVSAAMDARIDNRIMFSVGKAVKKMGLLGEDVKIIYGIPLCSNGKNPFFDRS
jgi:uncharacterized ferredoxin-like protein